MAMGRLTLGGVDGVQGGRNPRPGRPRARPLASEFSYPRPLAAPCAHQVRARSPQEVGVALLLILVWGSAVVPRVIQSFTAPKFRRTAGIDYGGYTAVAVLSHDVLRAAIVAVCVILVIDSVRARRRVPMAPLLLFLAPWAFMTIRDLYAHTMPSIDGLTYLGAAVALWAAHPSITCLRTLAHLTALAAAISMLMALISPTSALFRSTQGQLIAADKQIIPSGMLAGFLTQPNNLGQFIALGIPTIALVSRRSLRFTYLVLCVFAVVWSASRSSLYAIALVGAAALALSCARQPRSRCRVGAVAIVVSFGAVCILPFLTSDPTAYSGRGIIWDISLSAWRANAWFGFGANWYGDIATTTSSIMGSAFHGHNQLVHVLVTGGAWFALAIGAMLTMVAAQALRHAARGSGVGVLYLVSLAGTCLLEVSLVFVDNSSMFPVVVLPLAVLSFAARPPSPSAPVLVARHTHATERDADTIEDVALAMAPRGGIRREEPIRESADAAPGQGRGPRTERYPRGGPPHGAIAEQNLNARPPVARSHQPEPNPAA